KPPFTDEESERRFRETTRSAIRILAKSGDKTADSAKALYQPSQAWLDFMRIEGFGFRRVLKPRNWRETQRALAADRSPGIVSRSRADRQHCSIRSSRCA